MVALVLIVVVDVVVLSLSLGQMEVVVLGLVGLVDGPAAAAEHQRPEGGVVEAGGLLGLGLGLGDL